jgi:hypothetical protein
MERMEHAIFDVLDGMGADPEIEVIIHPTKNTCLWDIELRYEDNHLRFEVIDEKLPMVSLVENKGFPLEFEQMFQRELLDSLY